MKSFLNSEIDAESYCARYFDLMVKRMTVGEEESKILGIGYHDADDYDADLRLEHTILEPELKTRVAESLAGLTALGHKI